MNTIEKVRMLEWWIRQQEHNRRDLYVLRLDQFGNVVGKLLRNPLANPLVGEGSWELLDDGTNNMIDWGYLWFNFEIPRSFEKLIGCRKMTIFTSKLEVRRIITRGNFLYIAVGPSGFFGNFITPVWTSWKNGNV